MRKVIEAFIQEDKPIKRIGKSRTGSIKVEFTDGSKPRYYSEKDKKFMKTVQKQVSDCKDVLKDLKLSSDGEYVDYPGLETKTRIDNLSTGDISDIISDLKGKLSPDDLKVAQDALNRLMLGVYKSSSITRRSN